jgi:hypothetical protein
VPVVAFEDRTARPLAEAAVEDDREELASAWTPPHAYPVGGDAADETRLAGLHERRAADDAA